MILFMLFLAIPAVATSAGTPFSTVNFRAEKNGEMYRLSTEGYGTVDVLLERYLPDGIYRTSGKVYLVANGKKSLLRQGEVRRTILERVRNDYTFWSPVSEKDWDWYVYSCADMSQDAAKGFGNIYFDFTLGRCRNLMVGQWESAGWGGKMVMRVERNGELYYIDSEFGHVIKIGKSKGGESLMAKLTMYAQEVSRDVILNIPAVK